MIKEPAASKHSFSATPLRSLTKATSSSFPCHQTWQCEIPEKKIVRMGISSINGWLIIAMVDYQRVPSIQLVRFHQAFENSYSFWLRQFANPPQDRATVSLASLTKSRIQPNHSNIIIYVNVFQSFHPNYWQLHAVARHYLSWRLSKEIAWAFSIASTICVRNFFPILDQQGWAKEPSVKSWLWEVLV